MNVLITGISRGLGLFTAELLINQGWNVFGISVRKTEILETLIEKYPDDLICRSYDLSDPENIKDKIFKKWINTDIPIHGFVNNAAVAYDDLLTNMDLEKLEKMYKINVLSPIEITKNIIRNMLLHNIQGSIVHVSSISAHTGYKGLSMYASTKGAIESFSKNVAREWGVKGIRSNCVVAGFMETDMNSELSQEQKQRIYNRSSLKKQTEMRSVAESISFLLSDKAGSVTGQNIHVDAGVI